METLKQPFTWPDALAVVIASYVLGLLACLYRFDAETMWQMLAIAVLPALFLCMPVIAWVIFAAMRGIETSKRALYVAILVSAVFMLVRLFNPAPL
jgi:hypothetical protein